MPVGAYSKRVPKKMPPATTPAIPAAVEKRASKRLSPERLDAARSYLQAIVDRDFGGSGRAAADRLGISQSVLSDFLADKGGAGMLLLEKIADYDGTSIDNVVGRSVPIMPGTPQLANQPGFEAALEEARAAHPRVAPGAWTKVAAAVVPGLVPSAERLYELARVISETDHRIVQHLHQIDAAKSEK